MHVIKSTVSCCPHGSHASPSPHHISAILLWPPDCSPCFCPCPPPKSILDSQNDVIKIKDVSCHFCAQNHLTASHPTHGEIQNLQSATLHLSCQISFPVYTPHPVQFSHTTFLIFLEHTRQIPAPGPLHLLFSPSGKPSCQIATGFLLHPWPVFMQMPPFREGFLYHSNTDCPLPHSPLPYIFPNSL